MRNSSSKASDSGQGLNQIPIVFWVVGATGSGKTTLAQLLVDWLLEHFPEERVLAVDTHPHYPWMNELGGNEASLNFWANAIQPWLNQQRPLDRGLTTLPAELDWAMADCIIPLGENLDGLALGDVGELPRLLAHWLARSFKSYVWVVVETCGVETAAGWLHAMEREPVQLIPIGVAGHPSVENTLEWLDIFTKALPEGLPVDWVLHSPQANNPSEALLMERLQEGALTGRVLGRLAWDDDTPTTLKGYEHLSQAFGPLALRFNLDRLTELEAVASPLSTDADETLLSEDVL